MGRLFQSVLTSIKKRLLFSFFVIIAPMLLLLCGLVGIHFFMVNRYANIIDNLVFENKFTEAIPDLNSKYYALIISQKAKVKLEEYNVARENIIKSAEVLGKTIIDAHSKVYYRGIHNITTSILDNCDNGLKDASSGNLVGAFDSYDKNLVLVSYIKTSISNLMISELSYADKIKTYNAFLHTLILIVLGVVIVMVVKKHYKF